MPDQSYAATEHALLEEIITPLERLAADPLELVEADFPTAMRGYDKAAVDDYVRETSRLVAELQAVRSPESAVRRALVLAGKQISGVLRRAHETAAEITATSRSEAEDRLERARVEADEIMEAAERRVRDLDADTDRIWLDRQRIMADVEDLSGQLMGLAKQAGERFPDDEQSGDDEHSGDDGQAAHDEAGRHEQAADEGYRAASGDERPQPQPDREPAAWEQWAEHDLPSRSPETGQPSAPEPELAREPEPARPSLTDSDETLQLATPDRLDTVEPPEVEPRSARLSHRRRPDTGRDGVDSGSPGVIPPMSDAANRQRRS